jgi:hypothetical protein
LQVSGNSVLNRTLSSWLRVGLFAAVRPHSQPLRV